MINYKFSEKMAMNIFNTIKRRVSNVWRESVDDVVDLTQDSVVEESDRSGHSSQSSSGRSSASYVSSQSQSSSSHDASADPFDSTSSSTSPNSPPLAFSSKPLMESTPKSSMSAAPSRLVSASSGAAKKSSSPDLQIVTVYPKPQTQYQPKPLQPNVKVLSKPNSGLAPIFSSNFGAAPVPVYSKKEENRAKLRADLTQKIFTKKEALKKLEVIKPCVIFLQIHSVA
jgi:hypothetical protein